MTAPYDISTSALIVSVFKLQTIRRWLKLNALEIIYLKVSTIQGRMNSSMGRQTVDRLVMISGSMPANSKINLLVRCF